MFREGSVVLNEVVRVSRIEKLSFEQRCEGGEGVRIQCLTVIEQSIVPSIRNLSLSVI